RKRGSPLAKSSLSQKQRRTSFLLWAFRLLNLWMTSLQLENTWALTDRLVIAEAFIGPEGDVNGDSPRWRGMLTDEAARTSRCLRSATRRMVVRASASCPA